MIEPLTDLFEQHYSVPAVIVRELPRSGSPRRYFRLSDGQQTCIGAYSPDHRETIAFLAFTAHFRNAGLNVPELLATDPGRDIYLLEDLGENSLKTVLDMERRGSGIPVAIVNLYRSALDHLIRFQFDGHAGLDYSVCVPSQEFDRQSILWDLYHFKYYFLKLLNIPFDEQQLETDFNEMAGRLLGSERGYFMFRDFQSRNIMLKDDELYFIDYQGGRKGALQYDVASLLYEAKAGLTEDLREELLQHYLHKLKDRSADAADRFMEHYHGYVLVRILQALGAYGIRGLVENKALFLESIPYAIRNLQGLMDRGLVPEDLPALASGIARICSLDEWRTATREGHSGLRVNIRSFSFMKGIPRDLSGNGGGFVFDCRSLPNPGRLEQYRHLTGKDREVVEFLEGKTEVAKYLEQIFGLVSASVQAYRSLGYMDLMVSFGCTGGQHRSVYCAEKLKEYLTDNIRVKNLIRHTELD